LKKVIELARQYNFWVVHDLAYADIVFEGKAPSILEVEGAKSCAVEFLPFQKAMPCQDGVLVSWLAPTLGCRFNAH